ncbi:ISL3 family transposase [Methylobacterium sp. SI9]|uniref:ISL3 family transposase n=1 Tax=Methylobacterium guangdongense TaxID=3138811 RepID=UPI00313DB019
MARGWEDLPFLKFIKEIREYQRAPAVIETRRQRKVRGMQDAHFGMPAPVPPLKVTVLCESYDPVPDLTGHQCPDELADVVRHGRRWIGIKDQRIALAPTVLSIHRVRYICNRCKKTFDEYLPDVHAGHRITKRLHRNLAVASLNRPFAEVAKRNSVKPDLVETIFHEYRVAMMENYQADLPRVLAVDETKLLGAVRFVCSDLKEGRILDIVDDNRSDIEECFGKHSYHHRVQVFVQDMSYKYRSIAKDLFPYADVVVDRFHVVKRATEAVDTVRKAVAHRLPPHLKSALAQDIKLLVTNQSELSPKRLALLEEIKAHSPKLKRAHMLKEDFQQIYSINSKREAEKALRDWAGRLNEPTHRTVDRHFHTLRDTAWNDWRTEIFNFWEHPYTNAFVERMNRNLKEINRYANGLTFEVLRDKAILKYGHFHKMKEISLFNLVGLTDEEIAVQIEHRIWKGFKADSLARSLRAGMFEGHPPEKRERPVVLPDGRNQNALQAEWDEVERAWEEGPAFKTVTPEMAAEYMTPIQRNGIRNCFADWRLLPPDPWADMPFEPMNLHSAYNPLRHFQRRGRGHGRGRGMVLDAPPDPRFQSALPFLPTQRPDTLGRLFDL